MTQDYTRMAFRVPRVSRVASPSAPHPALTVVGYASYAYAVQTPLGIRIRERRAELDISLREFAERLANLSKAHLSDIELGRRNPSPQLLEKMAAVLGLELEELQRLDARPPIDDMRRRIEGDPALGFAFRRVIEDQSLSGDDLLEMLNEVRDRKKE